MFEYVDMFIHEVILLLWNTILVELVTFSVTHIQAQITREPGLQFYYL